MKKNEIINVKISQSSVCIDRESDRYILGAAFNVYIVICKSHTT